MAKFLEKMKKAGGEESEAVEAANAAEELREGDLIWLGSGAGGQWRLHRTGADGLAVRVLLDAAHTVVRGLRESRTQEGTHRFYRFRTPLRGRTHRFYWVAPFLSMVHVTSSSSNRPKLAKRRKERPVSGNIPTFDRKIMGKIGLETKVVNEKTAKILDQGGVTVI